MAVIHKRNQQLFLALWEAALFVLPLYFLQQLFFHVCELGALVLNGSLRLLVAGGLGDKLDTTLFLLLVLRLIVNNPDIEGLVFLSVLLMDCRVHSLEVLLLLGRRSQMGFFSMDVGQLLGGLGEALLFPQGQLLQVKPVVP